MQRLYLDQFRPATELVRPESGQVSPPCQVIDMHAHFGELVNGESYMDKYDVREKVETLKRAGLKRIFALDLSWGEKLDRLRRFLEASDGFILPVGSVDVSKAADPGFEKLAYSQLTDLKAKGCPAVKLWKDMTLRGRDYFGFQMALDDPRYACIFQISGELGLPVILHVADPPCFFRPNSPENEHYLCLYRHPEWSFAQPGIPSFEEHMRMQEAILSAHPGTTFIIAHVGSYAENLDKVSEWLERFSNMYIDISARVDQLGRQPYSARDFLIRWQDRVMFGTDYEAQFDDVRTERFYQTHYRFLQTRDEYFDHPFPDFLGQWKVYGLGLEPPVTRKIYHDNAVKLFKL